MKLGRSPTTRLGIAWLAALLSPMVSLAQSSQSANPTASVQLGVAVTVCKGVNFFGAKVTFSPSVSAKKNAFVSPTVSVHIAPTEKTGVAAHVPAAAAVHLSPAFTEVLGAIRNLPEAITITPARNVFSSGGPHANFTVGVATDLHFSSVTVTTLESAKVGASVGLHLAPSVTSPKQAKAPISLSLTISPVMRKGEKVTPLAAFSITPTASRSSSTGVRVAVGIHVVTSLSTATTGISHSSFTTNLGVAVNMNPQVSISVVRGTRTRRAVLIGG